MKTVPSDVKTVPSGPSGPSGSSDVSPEVVFYDGECGLCHATVKFVVPRDVRGAFVFAPLGGETFLATIPEGERAAIPDSVVVRTRDGRTLVRSAAVVHLLRALGGGWGVVGRALWIVPLPLRDLGYRGIARLRRSLFAKPAGACPILPPELRSRFRP